MTDTLTDGSADGLPELHLEVTSLVSHRTRRGLVALALGGVTAQFSPAKAREVAGMLFEAAEAAETDALFFAWAATMDLDDAAGAALLRTLRELRQARAGAADDGAAADGERVGGVAALPD